MTSLKKFGLIPSDGCKTAVASRAGKWTLLAFGRKPGTWQTFAIAQCDCGSPPKLVRLGNITKGVSTNCGCVRKADLTKHGLAKRGAKTRHGIYRVWSAMIDRCTNPHHEAYARYGGRGITVCRRWRNAKNFLSDMGPTFRPGLTIERRNNNAGYSPTNCYWATRSEQTRNRRTTRLLTHNGITKSIAAWASESNLSYAVLYTRVKRGWQTKNALSQKPRHGKRESA